MYKYIDPIRFPGIQEQSNLSNRGSHCVSFCLHLLDPVKFKVDCNSFQVSKFLGKLQLSVSVFSQ